MAVHLNNAVHNYYFGLSAKDRHELSAGIEKYAIDNRFVCPPQGVKWNGRDVHFVRVQGTNDIEIDWVR